MRAMRDKRQIEAMYYLSPLQEGLLFHRVADGEADPYLYERGRKRSVGMRFFGPRSSGRGSIGHYKLCGATSICPFIGTISVVCPSPIGRKPSKRSS
jgi:hypothetical protein